MLKKLLDGLDRRLDYRSIIRAYADRTIPGGPSWLKCSASCLLWVLIVQVVTGVLLMSSYSPSMTDAWGSVHYIEQSWAGSLLRGIHYFAAQLLIILFGLHMIRVLIVAGYRAPRELIWITGLILVPLVLAWAITGNPLSGAQKGLSQIDVEGHIIASTPGVGETLRRVLIGGDEVGNLTLTHLYTLHVAVLPFFVGVLLMIHVSQIYRYGLQSTSDAQEETPTPYWPFQTVRNMVVLTVVLIGVSVAAYVIRAPREVPASPDLPNMPRPEWYFLALFELRRYFSGDWEFIATLVIPLLILLVLLLLPLFDRWLSHRASVTVRSGIVVIGLISWGALTALPMWRDYHDGQYQAYRQKLDELGQRAWELADRFGIPPEGPDVLLASDPKIQGPRLFERHCASCHAHSPGGKQGIRPDKPSAPNLYAIGTAEWISGFFDPKRIASLDYFGGTAKIDGEMVATVQDWFADLEEAEVLEKRDQLHKIATLLAHEAGRLEKPLSDEAIEEARSLIVDEFACTDCHKYHDDGDLGSAPDLTGYASRDWLVEFIRNPNAERFYPDESNDRMPAFAPHDFSSKKNLLTRQELELIVNWLRGEWYEPEDPQE